MPRLRILVVEDSPVLRQVLAGAFPPDRFEVSTAADGIEALACLRSSPPDLIVSDVVMPRMDGWALCEEVRRDPSTRSLPFIFLSSERDIPKRIKGLELGADDYMVKPFSKEELVARVSRLLARCGSSPAESQAVPPPMALTGHTDHLPMPDLMQALSLNGSSGTLVLSGVSLGRVYFEEGRILNADTQGQSGEKALFRIMAWPGARFVFQPGPPPAEIKRVLEGSTASVLMEGFAHLDELREAVGSLPPPATLLRVRPDQAEALSTLELDTPRRLILHVAGARGARIDSIVDSIPQRDLEVYVGLQDLLERGLLEAVAAPGHAAEVSAWAPGEDAGRSADRP